MMERVDDLKLIWVNPPKMSYSKLSRVDPPKLSYSEGARYFTFP